MTERREQKHNVPESQRTTSCFSTGFQQSLKTLNNVLYSKGSPGAGPDANREEFFEFFITKVPSGGPFRAEAFSVTMDRGVITSPYLEAIIFL